MSVFSNGFNQDTAKTRRRTLMEVSLCLLVQYSFGVSHVLAQNLKSPKKVELSQLSSFCFSLKNVFPSQECVFFGGCIFS